MRKNVIGSAGTGPRPQRSGKWLDVGQVAIVEVTSEHPEYPIESVFTFGKGPGWRASERGEQTVRLVFDLPQRLSRIWLHFSETEIERTQEFTLRWSAEQVGALREIVRQQWNFSPHGATNEIEDYRVELSTVSVLELTINPDLRRSETVATLADWRLA